MKYEAQVPCRHATIKVEAESQKDLFGEIAGAYELFSEPACGLCGGTAIVPVKRTVTQGKKVYDYYEYRCTDVKCRGILAVGVRQEGGGLFPIRKLNRDGQPDWENGTYGPHRGWHKYTPKEGGDGK